MWFLGNHTDMYNYVLDGRDGRGIGLCDLWLGREEGGGGR